MRGLSFFYGGERGSVLMEYTAVTTALFLRNTWLSIRAFLKIFYV